eukprot:1304378-Pleurochrysis_carterae.AAC.1
MAEGEFEVFNKSGCEVVETYAYGQNADGSVVNDSVTEKWSMTLASPADGSTLLAEPGAGTASSGDAHSACTRTEPSAY